MLLGQAPVVPRRGDLYEPLAAVYSKECLPIAEARLAAGRRTLQGFVGELVERGLVRVRAVSAAEEQFLANVNTPEEFARVVARA